MSAGSESGHPVPSQVSFFFPPLPKESLSWGHHGSPSCSLPSGLAALCLGLTPRKPLGEATCCCCHSDVSEHTIHPQGPRTCQVPCRRTPSPTLSLPQNWGAKQARASGHKPPSKPKAPANPLPAHSPLRRPGRDQHHTTLSSRF